jgi:hypothetical protein
MANGFPSLPRMTPLGIFLGVSNEDDDDGDCLEVEDSSEKEPSAITNGW